MTGGQLRTVRLLEQCTTDFDVALYSVSDTADLGAMQQSAALRSVAPVRILPRPGGAPALWGSGASDIWQMVRPGLPAAVTPVGAEATIAALREAVASDKPMLLWAETQRMGEIARAAGLSSIIVDLNDLDALTLCRNLDESRPYQRRPIHRVVARRYRRYEQRIADRFGAVLLCKEEDRANLSTSPERVFVVPNGVAMPERLTRSRDENTPTALFVGTLAWEPNVEAIEWLVLNYLPAMRQRVPNLRLQVVGRGPIASKIVPLLERDGVQLSVSPPELAPFYAAANFVLAPVRTGGGTSIKSMEALAYRLPLIASNVAARGLDIESGQHFYLADTLDDFVETSMRILNDQTSADAVGERGFELVQSRYSWDAIGAKAREIIHGLLARQR